MKTESEKAGTRLLDVLDLHYHTEATNGLLKPIINSSDELSNNARLQATRILWDNSYIENSSAAQMHTQHIPLIPTLKASVDMYYPGTKLSFSEYNFGGCGRAWHLCGIRGLYGVRKAEYRGYLLFEISNKYVYKLRRRGFGIWRYAGKSR